MQVVQEKEMSLKTQEFIRKFKHIDQRKMNEITDKIDKQKEPVTVSQVEFIMR